MVGKEFLSANDPGDPRPHRDGHKPGDFLDFYTPQEVSHTYQAIAAGDYRIKAELEVDGTAAYDPAQCNVIIKSDGKEIAEHGYVWYDCEFYPDDEYVVHWDKGPHQVSFELQPLMADTRDQATKMDFKIAHSDGGWPAGPKRTGRIRRVTRASSPAKRRPPTPPGAEPTPTKSWPISPPKPFAAPPAMAW